ncbi:hypothetical protein [uncultured Paracoccus sp.]|uniref:hypothetical protein n=1 Tax=uncultured Paracoccus sp. TaxID=189685 RepID=UPI0025F554B2|nr:hypothetical protein [uncultured Paracoccus sp.]
MGSLLVGFIFGLIGAAIALLAGASLFQAFLAYVATGIATTLICAILTAGRARQRRRNPAPREAGKERIS